MTEKGLQDRLDRAALAGFYLAESLFEKQLLDPEASRKHIVDNVTVDRYLAEIARGERREPPAHEGEEWKPPTAQQQHAAAIARRIIRALESVRHPAVRG
jgi:hypothetical protein